MPYVVENPVTPKVRPEIAWDVSELQRLQRNRAYVIKTRIKFRNRLQAMVAGTMGYRANMPEKEREELFAKAGKMIDRIASGKEDSVNKGLIVATMVGIDALLDEENNIETEMLTHSKQLPVAEWVEHEDQRGFGMTSLGIVIGETGDLGNYANPGKVWRRLGCAPWTFEGRTLMGATWRTPYQRKAAGVPSLPESEWTSFGYSPRRRAISYLIGYVLMMQNGEGPYRKRYDDKKAAIHAAHAGYSDQQCHRHGMLMAGKLLLKNLWIEWNR